MNYEVKGTPLPMVECYLEAGESIKCENGAMSWMTPNLQMETSGGGIGKMFSKAISGEKMFENKYVSLTLFFYHFQNHKLYIIKIKLAKL